MQIETKEAMMLFEKKSKSMIRILRSNANNLEKSIIDSHTISSKYIEENKQETAAFDSMLRLFSSVTCNYKMHFCQFSLILIQLLLP